MPKSSDAAAFILTLDVATRDGANAFLLGILFNQGQRAELSWDAPHRLAGRIGTSDPEALAQMTEARLASVLAEPPSIHRYARMLARYVRGTCQVLAAQYDGDARRLWTPVITAHELERRLLGLPGIGPHKAAIAIHLLYQYLRVDVRAPGRFRSLSTVCPALDQSLRAVRHDRDARAPGAP